MATFTSKTLIPGQTPVGQNRDGSYIYEEVMSKATTAPKPITPIYTPPTAIPMVKSPLGFNTVPQVDKQVAQKVNAPVKDTLGLNSKIDSTSERTTQLRSHFSYLEDKGELFLNDKQSDYIKRFKTKYPDYQNVPDAILYGKVILTDPKTMEKYGNIGEKTFLQRLGNATYGNITALGDAVMGGVDAYKKYNIKDGGAMNEGVAVASGLGKFVGDTFTNVGANLLNLVTPKADKLKGTTSTSELLGKNVGETLKGAGDIVSSGIDWMAGEGWTEDTIKSLTEKVQNDPEAMIEFEAAMNILNILPGGFAAKTEKALTAKQILNNIAKDAELTIGKKGVFGTATKEAFDAGMNKGLVEGLSTGGTTLNEWMKKLPPEKQKGTTIGDKVTRTVPEKTISNYLGLTPTERANVEKILQGKTAEQYILENNLGGKTKGELTDIFQKQASDSYNGIKEQLKEITDRVDSKGAKTAIDDMLETFDTLSSLEKDIYKKDIDYLKTLGEQSDYSLSELHALRQAFDKVNTGMYTAKGAVRSGTRAGAEVEVRNMLSSDIQENAIKNGIDVKKMNQDLRVALTMKDGLLRSLSQESKNNLVGLQDIGIMGIFSGGEPLTAISLGVGKKFLEGKMPGMAQKLYNLNKTPYENTAVKRGNTIATNNGSRLFGLSDNMGSSSTARVPELATPKEITPVATGAGKSLAISAENKTLDAKKLLEKFEQLSPEEKAKAKMASPRLEELVKVSTEIKDIQEFKGDFGYMPPEIVQSLGDNYLNYSPEAKELIRKGLEKEDLAILQKMNREKAGLPEPVQPIKETPTEAPTTTETIEEVVKPAKKQETPKTIEQYNKSLQVEDIAKNKARNKGKTITIENKKTGATKTYEYDKDPAGYDMAELTVEGGLAKKVETPKLPVKTNEITPGKAEALKYENMKTEDLQNILIEENKRLIKEGHYANESKGDIEDMLYRKINSYGMWSTRDKIQPKFTSDLIDDTVSNLEQKGIEVYKSPYDKTPKTPQEGKTVKYNKKDIANKKYNPTEIYKDYTENYMHSDKWRGKSKAIVIDSDSIKKMFNEYDPKNPGLVHEESSNLSKEFFDRAVAENPNAPVIFSAGGPASGKSEGIINGYHGEKNVIFDTVLGDFEAFLRKAKSKIKDGKVKVHAIYTDIDTAKIYNAGRERSVSEKLLKEKHVGFRKAMHDLINSKEYKEGKIAVEVRANKSGTTRNIGAENIEQFIKSHKNTLDIIQ